MSIEVTKEVWDKIIEADNAPVDKEAVRKFVDNCKKSGVEFERILSTDELIDNYNKYYKKYIEYKKRALKAEKKLKDIETFIKD